MGLFPEGVSYHPGNPRKPYQARVQFNGRRYSLGYFPAIELASQAVRRVKAEIKEWSELRLPPPSLHRAVRAAERSAEHPPAPPAGS